MLCRKLSTNFAESNCCEWYLPSTFLSAEKLQPQQLSSSTTLTRWSSWPDSQHDTPQRQQITPAQLREKAEIVKAKSNRALDNINEVSIRRNNANENGKTNVKNITKQIHFAWCSNLCQIATKEHDQFYFTPLRTFDTFSHDLDLLLPKKYFALIENFGKLQHAT